MSFDKNGIDSHPLAIGRTSDLASYSPGNGTNTKLALHEKDHAASNAELLRSQTTYNTQKMTGENGFPQTNSGRHIKSSRHFNDKRADSATSKHAEMATPTDLRQSDDLAILEAENQRLKALYAGYLRAQNSRLCAMLVGEVNYQVKHRAAWSGLSASWLSDVERELVSAVQARSKHIDMMDGDALPRNSSLSSRNR